MSSNKSLQHNRKAYRAILEDLVLGYEAKQRASRKKKRFISMEEAEKLVHSPELLKNLKKGLLDEKSGQIVKDGS